MHSWKDFTAAAPEAAAMFERRLDATGLGLLATLRSDGWPRISPVEPAVLGDRIYLGMMPASTKSLDLGRDPRCCLHSATADKDVGEGDVKLFGRAVAVLDEDERHRYAVALKAHSGVDVYAMSPPSAAPDEPLHWGDLWSLDVTGASSLVPEGGDHLRITIWTEGGEERAIEKY